MKFRFDLVACITTALSFLTALPSSAESMLGKSLEFNGRIGLNAHSQVHFLDTSIFEQLYVHPNGKKITVYSLTEGGGSGEDFTVNERFKIGRTHYSFVLRNGDLIFLAKPNSATETEKIQITFSANWNGYCKFRTDIVGAGFSANTISLQGDLYRKPVCPISDGNIFD